MKQILKKLIALGSLAACFAMNQRGRGFRYIAPGQNVYMRNFREGMSFNPRVICNGVLQAGQYTYFSAESSPPEDSSSVGATGHSTRTSNSSHNMLIQQANNLVQQASNFAEKIGEVACRLKNEGFHDLANQVGGIAGCAGGIAGEAGGLVAELSCSGAQMSSQNIQATLDHLQTQLEEIKKEAANKAQDFRSYRGPSTTNDSRDSQNIPRTNTTYNYQNTPRTSASRQSSSQASSSPTFAPMEPFNSFGIPQRPVDKYSVHKLNINFMGSQNSFSVGRNLLNTASNNYFEVNVYWVQSVIIFKQKKTSDYFDIISQYFGNLTDSKLPFVGIQNVEFTENNIDNLDLLILADERLEKMIFYQCKFINQSALKFLLQNPKNVKELKFIECGLTEDEVEHLRETEKENNILITIVS